MVAFRKPWQLRIEQEQEAIKEARNMIATVTISGVVISIILAALLFFYFIRNIHSGISHLMENTLRFARKEPLMPPTNRSDELAQLDRIFHEMAEYVEGAEIEKEKLQQLKQDFFHMITHDMRTPLSSLVLSIDSLASGIVGDIPEEAMPTLGSAERSVNMLMNLITDLLDLETAESQGIKLHMEEFDIRDMLDEVADVVEFMTDRAGITIKIECSADTLYADRIRILRVITNLVSNAIKFSPSDSTITMIAKPEGHKIDFEVIDEGRGVPQEQRKKIFDRFHQVENDDSRKKKGSGLGLSIAKTFVEAHGGRIGVESASGKGSKFWFWIPQKNC
jgi:signal transduction histidine kinase